MPNRINRPRIVVVVAAYNEAATVRRVVEGLLRTGADVVVVDDGSTDGTLVALDGCRVSRLRHPVNRGAGAALQTGINFALRQDPDVIVSFDADGQHDPGDLPAMVEPILNGTCDVTLGSRFLDDRSNPPLLRRLILKLGIVFTAFTSGVRLTDAHCGFRAFSRDAAASLHITLDRMAHASELVDQVHSHGWHVREVPVRVLYTPYSLGKGQRNVNAIRVAVQVLLEKLR